MAGDALDLGDLVAGDQDGAALRRPVAPCWPRNSRRTSRSRPEVGSSRISTSGSMASARARPTLAYCPLDRMLSRASGRAGTARSGRGSGRGSPSAWKPEVNQPISLDGHPVVELGPLRHVADAAAQLRRHRVQASWPRTRAQPRSGGVRPLRMRMVVDLPAPLSPSRAKIEPAGTLRLRRSRAILPG